LAIRLNHTIVYSNDKAAGAAFLVGLFELRPPSPFGPFLDVALGNGVTLAFMDAGEMDVQPQHYAFLVSDEEFDRIYAAIVARGLPHWDGPHKATVGINHNNGGRGVYFDDPSGHLLEIITTPYGVPR